MRILILLLLSPLLCLSQVDSSRCNQYTQKTYDKISGKTFISNKDGFTISDKSGNSVDIMAQIGGSGQYATIAVIFYLNKQVCTDKGDEINFLFRDGSRMTMQNESEFDCKGRYSKFLFKSFNSKTIEKLALSPIEAIRFNSRSKIIDFQFSESEGVSFCAQIECLYQILNEIR